MIKYKNSILAFSHVECTKKLVKLVLTPYGQVLDMMKMAENGMRRPIALAVISMKSAAEKAVSMAK